MPHGVPRMIDVRSLLDKHMRATKLEILVFGPAIDPVSKDPYIASLQRKRKQIKDCLRAEGHDALFGEDVVDPSLPARAAAKHLRRFNSSSGEARWQCRIRTSVQNSHCAHLCGARDANAASPGRFREGARRSIRITTATAGHATCVEIIH